ncbi:MAG: putative methyltransferase (TIGR04325 family) [Candidatus Azotimanducaceae bacterium]|jgi:putative methyltransferase (TIGR04325 family)
MYIAAPLIYASNMSQFRQQIKSLVPPIILNWWAGMRGYRMRYVGPYDSWNDAAAAADGYDATAISQRVLTATIEVQENRATFERDGVTFDHQQYHWPLLSSLLWVANQNQRSLRVLDFGGSMGGVFLQHEPMLAECSVDWRVIEQPDYVDLSQQHIKHPALSFYLSVNDANYDSQANVAILGSVLQYLESPEQIMTELNATGIKYLIIDRTPFVTSNQNQFFVQKVAPQLYKASYPIQLLSKSALLEQLAPEWRIVAELPAEEGAQTTDSGVVFEYSGLLLERRT